MVEVGGRPLLWHIMRLFGHHGLQRFVLCLGYKGSTIKEYFLNYEAMTQDCTVAIGRRIADLLQPKWLRIGGYWYPRGGIPIDVFWQTGVAPEGLWLPDQGVPTYRGRG